MCTSKPRIPENKAPPPPGTPEPNPDAPRISDRAQFLRGRGVLLNARPNLTGLGNDNILGPVLRRLMIGAGSSTVYDPDAPVAAPPPPRIMQLTRGSARGDITYNTAPTSSRPSTGPGRAPIGS